MARSWYSLPTYPNAMCHHSILAVLQFTVVNERAKDAGEILRLGEIHELYSPAVFGALLATMGCEDCASAVLVRTFRALRISEQESPKLYRILQGAFTFSCAATPEADREELRERIRKWFMKGHGIGSMTTTTPQLLAAVPLAN